MTNKPTPSPYCCEDEGGNALCKFVVGVFCSARVTDNGITFYKTLTRDGIELMRHCGCRRFISIEKPGQKDILGQENWT